MRGRTHHVVLLDASLSLTRSNAGGLVFDRARAQALEVARRAASGDGFSLIVLAAPPRVLIAGPADHAAAVIRELEEVRPTHGPADLAAALAQAEELLRRSPGKYARRELSIVSDLQRATWSAPSTPGASWLETWQRLAGLADIHVIDVGGSEDDNLAVTGLELADPLPIAGTQGALIATVANWGTRDRVGVPCELRAGEVGGRSTTLTAVAQELVTIPAGGTATVSFPHAFRAAGTQVFQVRLPDDALEADNQRSLVAEVRDQVPVLVVNGKPAADRFEQATAWLADALQPFAEPRPRANYPARPRVVDLAQFSDPGRTDLSAWDVVFLCDVPRLAEREAARLEAFVQRGGGLVICLGPHVDLEAYNRVLYQNGQGLLPAKLVRLARADADSWFSLAATEEAMQKPPLQAFAGDHDRASLLAARVRSYVGVELPPGSAARTLLSLVPAKSRPGVEPAARRQDPLLLSAPRGRGQVVLLTTTVNTDWTSWPIAPSFPPFVQELFRSVVLQPRRTLEVGEAIEEWLPARVLPGEARLATPSGATVAVPLRADVESTRLEFRDTDQSGLYRLKLGTPGLERVYAVNVPAQRAAANESDLRRIGPDELEALTQEDGVQVVTEVDQIRPLARVRTESPADETASLPAPSVLRGPGLARGELLLLFALLVLEGVLAWRFGSARQGVVPGLDQPEETAGRRWGDGLAAGLALVPIGACLGLALFLLHAAWSDDVLGFLPASWRSGIESGFGVPPAAEGESTRWRLEFLPFLTGDPRADRWLAALLGLGAMAAAFAIYRRELSRLPRRGLVGVPLLGARLGLLLLLLTLLLPQVKLLFEREGWPDLVLLIDDSRSMGHVDDFQDDAVRARVKDLLRGKDRGGRLELVQSVIGRDQGAWLDGLLERRARLHVYHCSALARKLAVVENPRQREAGREAVAGLKAEGGSSALGQAVRGIVQEFRGSALAGIILFSDGVTTEGEDLPAAAQQAARAGVPLYLVGVGDAHEPRDLVLSDLQVEDAVQVQDRLIFEARLTVRGGIRARSVPVSLYEKQGEELKLLAREDVALGNPDQPVRVRLNHRPTVAGEHEYILDVPVQPEEAERSNNRLERRIFVADFQRTRVLYIEGYPRYEYRFLKSLLERESAALRGNKTIDLRVLLLDADPDFARQDRTALEAFPSTREELFRLFDLVIVGDVDPRHPKLGEKHWQWLADFVREKGGGMLFLSGTQFLPRAFRETALADVLPVELTTVPPEEERDRVEGYRLELTPVGRLHPQLRLLPDEQDNGLLWERMPLLFWSAGAYKLKPAAEVLARRAPGPGSAGEPLIVQHFAGAGRAMWFGFDEAWRWRFREFEGRYNQFWIQTIRYLGRSRQGRIDLRVDKQVPYRQGEPIRVTARFPEDVPPPAPDVQVRVAVEQRDAAGKLEGQTLQLGRVEGSRATFEALLTRTTEGQYRFQLAAPASAGTRPEALARVLPPPGENDRLRMDQVGLEQAAKISGGKYFSLANVDDLPESLPPLPRVPLDQPRPPWPLWNQPAIFALALGLLGGEWLYRKRRQLL